MQNENDVKRNAPKDNLMQRFQAATIKPETLDEKTRSIEVIGAKERPCLVWDPQRWEAVSETLQMSGCQIPASRQIPLTIDHDDTARSVIGPFSDMRIEGDQLLGRAVFSSSPDAEPFYTKVKEGHLNRFSIVYPADSRQSVFVEENTTAVVNGKSYTGPVLVTNSWQPKSLGLVLYAADDRATARSTPHTSTIHKETSAMDKRMRAYLERHGLSPDATEDEAWAFLDKQEKTPTQPDSQRAQADTQSASDIERANADIVRIERERIIEITGLCQRFNCEDMAATLIKDGATMDAARQAVLKKLDATPPAETPSYRPATHGADGWDKFRSAAEDGLMIRSGIAVAKPSPGAVDIAGWSMLELARHALIVSNKPSGGSKLEMVGRALTTSDFPYLLANVANKSLFAGWDAAEETWSRWCATGSVPDFKTQYLPRVSEAGKLEKFIRRQIRVSLAEREGRERGGDFILVDIRTGPRCGRSAEQKFHPVRHGV